MRVLIVYEDTYRAYGETLEGAIWGLRPRVEVALAPLQELEAEVERFDPHLVVSDVSNTVDPGGRAAWVTLSYNPSDASKLCLDGQQSELTNPRIEELLEIIDEAEELVRTGLDLGGC